MNNPTPAAVVKSVEEARLIARRTFALSDHAWAVYLAAPSGEIVVDRAGRVMPAADFDALRRTRFQAAAAKAG